MALDRLATLKTLTGESNDDLLTVYLDMADSEILRRRYPFGIPEDTEIPDMYEMLSVQIAEALFDKRGAEGQTSHSENSISRSFATDGIPNSLLQQIIPLVSAITTSQD